MGNMKLWNLAAAALLAAILGACSNDVPCSVDADCPSDSICAGGRCGVRECSPACDDGFECIRGECAARMDALCSDAKPNGLCPSGQTCIDGLCCAEGMIRCGKSCIDPNADRSHCGECGGACEVQEVCIDGACQCAPGQKSCNGTCVDTTSDSRNCGACGNTCGVGTACVDGECTCPSGWLVCGGACVNPDENASHCGACGNICPSGRACVDGQCACPAGTELCGGACVNTDTASNHCGGCGNVCPGTQSCVDGECSCPGGLVACGDGCVDTDTDPDACGACSNVCPDQMTCVAGDCACASGLTECDGACVDAQNSTEHCGRCNNACGASEICDQGECVLDVPHGTLTGRINPFRPATVSTTNAAQSVPSEVREAMRGGVSIEPSLPRYEPGALLVKLKASSAQPAWVLKVLGTTGVRLSYKLGVSPHWHSLYVLNEKRGRADDRQVEEAIEQLRRLPAVEYVERVGIARPMAIPNDPGYQFQWHYPLANLPAAWDITTGSASVTVAVLDDGTLRHPDFGNRQLQGYDFVSHPENAADGDGWDGDPVRPAIFPDGRVSFHGAHVAGTIGAATNNGVGVAGVDWKATLLPVRVLGVYGGSDDDIVAGMRWSAGLPVPGAPANPKPADVLNMSLGGPGWSQAYQDAIDEINGTGAIVVVAAGNSNKDASLFTPAGQSGVITVGAVGKDGLRSSYSNYGAVVDVMAPGGDFEDLDRDGRPDSVLSLWGDEYGRPTFDAINGTSMASPHVAGIVALMKAVKPNLNYAEAEAILRATALPYYRCAEGCGAGLVDAYAAVRQAAGLGQQVKPRLVVVPGQVEFAARSEASVDVYNAGGSPLDFTAALRGIYSQHAELLDTGGQLQPGGSMTLRMRVHRGTLPNDTYRFTLRLESNGGDVDVPVTFRVGPRPVPEVWVLAAEWDGSELRTVAATKADSNADYSFLLRVPVGTYYLIAGTDENGNMLIGEEGEQWGIYPIPSDPVQVQVIADQLLGNLDFSTSLSESAPEPGDGEFLDACQGNADCESLLCLSDGVNGFCSMRCEVDADCPSSFICEQAYFTNTGASVQVCMPVAAEGGSCLEDRHCGTGFCFQDDSPYCATSCTFDTDCGPGRACRQTTDSESRVVQLCVDLTPVGGACEQSNECVNPNWAICLSWWPDGYCASQCDYDADCPTGSACLKPRESMYFGLCFDTCTTGADCREGYECGLFSGRRICKAPVKCGDGVVALEEDCDDGNKDNTDECTNQCRWATCGDGYRQAGEECDDGNANDFDGCTSECLLRTPCEDHFDCNWDSVCVDSLCEITDGRTFDFFFASATVPSTDNGSAWDFPGGAPDPFVRLYVNDRLVGSTSAKADTYTPAWYETISTVIRAGDSITIWIYDEDIASHDVIDGAYVADAAAWVRYGGMSGPLYSGSKTSLSLYIWPQ